MASSRQIQVMKLRVREKLDDIFSQQKTIIATVNSMTFQVKKKADKLLKSTSNNVTVSDFVNVLQDLERCFNNLIAIAATTEDLFFPNDLASNTLCENQNVSAEPALSEYQIKWLNKDIPEFRLSQKASSLIVNQLNCDNSFIKLPSNTESIVKSTISHDSQSYLQTPLTDNHFLSECNDSVNFTPSHPASLSEQIPPVKATVSQIDTIYAAASQVASLPQKEENNPILKLNPESLFENANLSTQNPEKKDANISNIVSSQSLKPNDFSIDEPYGTGPKLVYQKVSCVMNVQVCETVTPYCFWIQSSNSLNLLEKLAAEIQCFTSLLMQGITQAYEIVSPVVGMICITQFTNGCYYRVKVLEVIEDQDEETLLPVSSVNVLYLDYGNMDIVPSNSLIKMPKSFAKYPIQAICCALSKVMPIDVDEDWSAESSEFFHNMVYCKELVCKPVYSDGCIPQLVDLYLPQSVSAISLEDLENRQESRVGSILIKQGYALPIKESDQVQKIFKIIKNWILFKSSSLADDVLVGKPVQKGASAFNFSTDLFQAGNNLEVHQQYLKVCKESNPLDYQMVTVSKASQINNCTTSCPEATSSNSALDPNSLYSNSKISQRVTTLEKNSDLKSNLKSSDLQAVVCLSNKASVTASSSPGDIISSNLKNKNGLATDSKSIHSNQEPNHLHPVMISHIKSPSSFYVHHISKETKLQLEKLVHNMNADFQCLSDTQLAELSSKMVHENGKLCCAYLSEEKVYYRALIIETKKFLSAGLMVKVFYVDFGDSEWLHCNKIYLLPEPYCNIPSLAQHCALAYIQAPQGLAEWPAETKTILKNMINPKETYFIEIVAGSSKLGMPSLANYKKAPVKVLITNYGKQDDNKSVEEICLNYELIDHKLAELNTKDIENSDIDMWDPMSEDYESRRNRYDVNPDDPEIASVGFKVKDEVKICKFFRDGRKCWLGKKCPYKHIRLEKDCFTADKREAVCDLGQLKQIELPQVGSLIGVEVSAVSSPVQFYVIFPWGTESVKNLNSIPVYPNKDETLPDLQDSLQEFYEKLPPRAEENLLWTIGELVVAQAPADKQWYRARVTEVNDTSNMVKVFFVDFGNVDWVYERHIQPIQQEFVHLPHQAVECCLDKIASSSVDDLWTREARDYFLELVDDVVLVARVNTIVSKRLYIDLFNTWKKEDQNIAEELVRAGVARKVEPKPSTLVNKTTDQNESTETLLFTPG